MSDNQFGDQLSVQASIGQSIEDETERLMALDLVEARADQAGKGIAAVFDIAAIITIITTIFESIAACRGSAGGEIARARKRPRGLAARGIKIGLRRANRRSGQSRREAREWANAAYAAMLEADEEDLSDVLARADAVS